MESRLAKLCKQARGLAAWKMGRSQPQCRILDFVWRVRFSDLQFVGFWKGLLTYIYIYGIVLDWVVILIRCIHAHPRWCTMEANLLDLARHVKWADWRSQRRSGISLQLTLTSMEGTLRSGCHQMDPASWMRWSVRVTRPYNVSIFRSKPALRYRDI